MRLSVGNDKIVPGVGNDIGRVTARRVCRGINLYDEIPYNTYKDITSVLYVLAYDFYLVRKYSSLIKVSELLEEVVVLPV